MASKCSNRIQTRLPNDGAAQVYAHILLVLIMPFARLQELGIHLTKILLR